MTTADAVVLQSAGLVAVAGVARDRLRAMTSPRAWASRRERVRREEEAFLESLRLDPEAVLGPPPDVLIDR